VPPRTAYRSPQERAPAPPLTRTWALRAGRTAGGSLIEAALAQGRETITDAGFVVDYLEARHAETLQPVTSAREPIRLLVAAKLGKTRLIDNLGVAPAVAKGGKRLSPARLIHHGARGMRWGSHPSPGGSDC